MSLANYGTLTTNALLGRVVYNSETNGTLTVSNTDNGLIHIKSNGQIRIGNSGTTNEQVLVDKGTLTAKDLIASTGSITGGNAYLVATGTFTGGHASVTANAFIATLTDSVATLAKGSLTSLSLLQASTGSITGGNTYLVATGTFTGGHASVTANTFTATLTDSVATLAKGSLTSLSWLDTTTLKAGTGSITGGNAYLVATGTFTGGHASITDTTYTNNLTVGAVTIPNTHGTSNQVLVTSGSGALTWATQSGGGSTDKISEGNTEVETVDTGSDGHIKFTTEGSERVRITSNGIGIGVTNPDCSLCIRYSNTLTTADEHHSQCGLQFRNTDDTNNNWTNIVFNAHNAISAARIGCQYVNQTNGYGELSFAARSSGGWNYSILKLAGDKASFNINLGIGDTDPGTLLQLSSGEPYITLKNTSAEYTDGGCESKIIFEDHANITLAQIQGSHDGTADDTKGDLIFSTHSGSALTERMRIDSSGNVGIGFATPSYKLNFATSVGTKICFYNSGSGNIYGLGVSGNQLNYHVDTTASDHVFYATGDNGDGTEVMRIKGTGNVGIGATNPGATLTVDNVNIDDSSIEQVSTNSLYINDTNVNGIGIYTRNDLRIRGTGASITIADRNSSSGNTLSWTTYTNNSSLSDNRYYYYSQSVSTGNRGWVSSSGSNSQINFTAQHKCVPKDESKVNEYKNKKGYIVVSSGEYYNMFNIDNESDPTKIQVSECLPTFELSNAMNDKNVFGVIGGYDERTTVTDIHGNTETVSHFGWGNMNYGSNGEYTIKERFKINSGGEGAIMVSNYSSSGIQTIEKGDYITTSPIEGIGMKQSDDILHNYTVAKALNDDDFTSDYSYVTYNGTTYKYKLIGCTYHCG